MITYTVHYSTLCSRGEGRGGCRVGRGTRWLPALCRREGGRGGWRVGRGTRWYPRPPRKNQVSSAVPTQNNVGIYVCPSNNQAKYLSTL